MIKAGLISIILCLIILNIHCQGEDNLAALSIEYKSLYDKLLKQSDLQAQQSGLLSADPVLRYNIFLNNVQTILKANQNTKNTYTSEINRFALLTTQEFEQYYLGLKEEDKRLLVDAQTLEPQRNLAIVDTPTEQVASLSLDNVAAVRAIAIPSSINWTAKGKVTPIRNQGSCGSCWAFATTAAVQSAYLIQLNLNTYLSNQQLIDCSSSYGNNGCNGGWMYRAFNYIKAKKITTNSIYPYTAKTGTTCKYNGVGLPIVKYTNATNIATNCAPLKTAVASRPQTVAVYASNWAYYKNGTFNSCSGSSVNHGVLLVGYDSSSNWIIKNSWGTSWGVKGYITLKSGNCCQICKYYGSAPYL